MNMNENELSAVVEARAPRDAGKRFRVGEIAPLVLSGYMLRLVAALKGADYESLVHELREARADTENPDAALNVVLRTLSGCDPTAVHALITDLLSHVEVAADPRHPEGFRPLLPTDIRELKTLGDVLIALVVLNLGE